MLDNTIPVPTFIVAVFTVQFALAVALLIAGYIWPLVKRGLDARRAREAVFRMSRKTSSVSAYDDALRRLKDDLDSPHPRALGGPGMSQAQEAFRRANPIVNERGTWAPHSWIAGGAEFLRIRGSDDIHQTYPDGSEILFRKVATRGTALGAARTRLIDQTGGWGATGWGVYKNPDGVYYFRGRLLPRPAFTPPGGVATVNAGDATAFNAGSVIYSWVPTIEGTRDLNLLREIIAAKDRTIGFLRKSATSLRQEVATANEAWTRATERVKGAEQTIGILQSALDKARGELAAERTRHAAHRADASTNLPGRVTPGVDSAGLYAADMPVPDALRTPEVRKAASETLARAKAETLYVTTLDAAKRTIEDLNVQLRAAHLRANTSSRDATALRNAATRAAHERAAHTRIQVRDVARFVFRADLVRRGKLTADRSLKPKQEARALGLAAAYIQAGLLNREND